MKVVLFCGGYGMRLYPTTGSIPKPLVPIGDRPIMWNIMKYYSHFGHKDFILCLGYKGDQIRKYFLNYTGDLPNGYILSNKDDRPQLSDNDVKDWNITFVDTGLHSSVGERFKAIQKYVESEEIFLANYSDAVTDLYLPNLIDFFLRKDKIGCFLSVAPPYTFHIVTSQDDGIVEKVYHVNRSGIRINGGFFIFKKEIFDYIYDGEDLVNEPFQRLIEKKELLAYKYDGFWVNMDTYKDKKRLDDLFSTGQVYWQVWKR